MFNPVSVHRSVLRGKFRHTLCKLAVPLLLTSTQAMALQCPPGQWMAEYFPNKNLAGTPVLQRCESGPIDHYWTGSEGSPDPDQLPVDGFSARWTAFVPFAGGQSTFTTFTDDGVRVYVDGRAVIDNWTEHGITMDTASVPLTAGDHAVRMEYFEAGGEGLAQLVIEQDSAVPPPPAIPRILAFTAQPNTVNRGDVSILNWSTENATDCVAFGGGVACKQLTASLACIPRHQPTMVSRAVMHWVRLPVHPPSSRYREDLRLSRPLSRAL